LSIPTVYTRPTRELIASEGNLHALLSYYVHPQLRRSDLPSWVPDHGLSGSNAIPKPFSADKGLKYIPPRAVDPDCPVLHIRGTFAGYVSQVRGRPGTGEGEKLRFDRSWLTLPLSLRSQDGYKSKPIPSYILWQTLCMNVSMGSVLYPGVYGDRVPEDLGIQFRYFLLLLILAAADDKIHEKVGLQITTL
jgi:hypothetical protein